LHSGWRNRRLGPSRLARLRRVAGGAVGSGAKDLRRQSLLHRKRSLRRLIEKTYGPDQVEVRFVEHFESGGDAVLKSACRMSLEGIVSKQTTAPYVSGRTESWSKAKCRAGHEVVIGGWNSNGSQFRSLMAGVYGGDHLVYVGNVGTGFAAEKVASLMPRLKAPAHKERDALAKARTCCRNRICRLYGSRHDSAGRI
jgi:ATP-dependent DNA ligase